MVPRRTAIFLLTAVILAQLSTNASAYIQPILTRVASPPGTPFIAPDAALGAPWVSYQLSLQSTAGEQIGGVDVWISSPFLHQRWNDTDDDGVSNPSPNGTPSNGRADSHLTAPSGSQFVIAPTETNSKTGSPLVSSPGVREYGLGSLRGAWRLSNPTTNADFAYIVFNENNSALLDIAFRASDPTGNIIALGSSCSFTFCTRSIGVTGGGVPIADGDVSPNILDNTDFGTVAPGSLQQRSFTITNPDGDSPMALGTPMLNGPFFIVGDFPTYLLGSTTITIGLDTSKPGNKSGSFSLDISESGPFNFALAAHVIPEPAGIFLATLAAVSLLSAISGRYPPLIAGKKSA